MVLLEELYTSETIVILIHKRARVQDPQNTLHFFCKNDFLGVRGGKNGFLEELAKDFFRPFQKCLCAISKKITVDLIK